MRPCHARRRFRSWAGEVIDTELLSARFIHDTELTAGIAVELDGFAYLSDRDAFTYDRLRQNDLQLLDWRILRFSYDAIRLLRHHRSPQSKTRCNLRRRALKKSLPRHRRLTRHLSPQQISLLVMSY